MKILEVAAVKRRVEERGVGGLRDLLRAHRLWKFQEQVREALSLFFLGLSNLPHGVTEHEIRWFLGAENDTMKLVKVNREDERLITKEEEDKLLSFVGKQESQTTDDSDLKQQVSADSATASTAASSESIPVPHNNMQSQDQSSGETFANSVEQFVHAA
ncbi:unnamed protein product [Toxocara canis]|uniref:FH2 domain-containing protein n=1 Tax=Toxocara canis TaxID=6265 RepID=A0A183UQR4_TOXCA|nr:unnamed protein product [Toxocara canis]